MSNSRDYTSLSRSKSPSADSQSGFFQTGQGGRTILPPLSSPFQTSSPTVPVYPQYSQQRSSPGYESHYPGQWTEGGPGSYDYYPNHHHDPRYAGSGYTMYPANASSDSRKLPPLSTNHNGGREDRWAAPYATSSVNPGHGGIRSPTASYPASYNNAYPSSANAYGYSLGPEHPAVSMSSHHGMSGHEGRSSSPYPQVPSSYTPPPISPTSGPEDSPTIKKKRKRADAAQLKILNETYARTAFPSTEERLQLAKMLDMSARSVQIWFQNKRQSMRQTRQSSSSTHQTFALGGDEDTGYATSAPYVPRASPESHGASSSSHRRPRSQEAPPDQRQWSRGY